MQNLKTAIMGLGNPYRSDDAVGIYVIDELKKTISVVITNIFFISQFLIN